MLLAACGGTVNAGSISNFSATYNMDLGQKYYNLDLVSVDEVSSQGPIIIFFNLPEFAGLGILRTLFQPS